MLRTPERLLRAGEGEDSAASFYVAYEASMDASTTYKGIASISGFRQVCIFFLRAAYHKRPIVNLLISDCMIIHDVDSLAIRWASKGERAIFKGTTEIAIESAAVTVTPGIVSTQNLVGPDHDGL
jgi:hypothetical protein